MPMYLTGSSIYHILISSHVKQEQLTLKIKAEFQIEYFLAQLTVTSSEANRY